MEKLLGGTRGIDGKLNGILGERAGCGDGEKQGQKQKGAKAAQFHEWILCIKFTKRGGRERNLRGSSIIQPMLYLKFAEKQPQVLPLRAAQGQDDELFLLCDVRKEEARDRGARR
jgi:hypothetical protein